MTGMCGRMARIEPLRLAPLRLKSGLGGQLKGYRLEPDLDEGFEAMDTYCPCGGQRAIRVRQSWYCRRCGTERGGL